VSVVDDAANMGAILIKATVPEWIGAGAPDILRSPIIDQAPTIPPSGGHGRKHLCLIARCSDPVPQANQVMTQVVHPPCRGPHSLLDLIAIEIVFGRIFEAFRQMSHAAAAGAAPAANDNTFQKRHHQIPLKKTLTPRYSYTFLP
jgi:hypothetical protein